MDLSSLFGHDVGNVTKEEWDQFISNTIASARAEVNGEEESEDVHFGQAATLAWKVRACLKEKEMETLYDVVAHKASGEWGPQQQQDMDRLEAKVVTSTKEKRDKIRNVQAQKSKDNSTAKQRVRIKSTGKTGISLGSLSGDRTGKAGHVIFLEDGTHENVDRDDIDILCSVCQQEIATKRCAKCKGPWYCGRECQRKDWKQHRKQCRPVEEA